MSLFISSAEASGDHYTAALAKKLRACGYDGAIWGMGGAEPRGAGVDVLWPGERLQLLGLTEVLPAIPSILSLLSEMTDTIVRRKPDAVVVCDSPDFHMRLIAKLRRRGYGGRIFYISPPSVWAWRSGRAEALRRYVDVCLPLFQFEHEYLLSRGCCSRWKGYPLLEEFRRGAELSASDYPVPASERMVAFLPGSRRSEINKLLPIMRESAERLAAEGWSPVFSVAPGLNPAVRDSMIDEFTRSGVSFYTGPGRELMKRACCAVGASGTITVESLILGCYMVVTYKLNPISALVARCVIKTRRFAMANILAGCDMFPELLQEKATAENITECALAWLNGSSEFRAGIKDTMARAMRTLGEEGVYDFWSEEIMKETERC
ncbi:MAG: lipid-A-disaccharide synthase [Synergistes sp.]|nr:lipid-A-disaccharide synthase [Synergistes sp.]